MAYILIVDDQEIHQYTKRLLNQIFTDINAVSTDPHINDTTWCMHFILFKYVHDLSDEIYI